MKYQLFHGSNADFKTFDPSKVRYVGCNGDGFYFTPCERYAKTYGSIVKKWQVEIKNALTPETKVLTINDYKDILKYIWNSEEKEDIKNYGWFDDLDFPFIMEGLAKYFYNKESDYVALFDLVHTVTGSMKNLLNILKKVSEIHFDAVISVQMQEYVVFNNNQIKLI